MSKSLLGSWQYGEVNTLNGGTIRFTARPDDVEEIKVAIAKARDIDWPHTARVNVQHGGYGRYTRYDIQQHKYAGGHGGYIEVLEIRDPIESKAGYVIYHMKGHDSFFVEYETLEAAKNAFEAWWRKGDDRILQYKSLPKETPFYQVSSPDEKKKPLVPRQGFIRRVECGLLSPWFYAIGNQLVAGDYAFPEELQDDPVYVAGKDFIVTNRDGFSRVLTCLGCRHIERERNPYSCYHTVEDKKITTYRVVYFQDGSRWDESRDPDLAPRPLEEGQAWVAEAVDSFQRLLAGGTEELSINLLDGRIFRGRLVRPKTSSPSKEGHYCARVSFADGGHREGSFDYSPTPEFPDVRSYLMGKMSAFGEVTGLEISHLKTKGGGKKWSGVFY